MITVRQELRRLWHTLVGRGALMLVLGLGAVIWPEDVLIAAMILVGMIATLFGLYEITIALSIRAKTSGWTLILLHGIAALSFGALTLGGPRVTLGVALALVAGWMLVYAAWTTTMAIVLWHVPPMRWALLGWTAFDVSLAFVSVLFPEATIFALLYFGAVYAAGFGAWQLVAGLWLRRTVKHPPFDLPLKVFATAHS
jgi:uncharacterized membrane protein HdeD (DUF308 family)